LSQNFGSFLNRGGATDEYQRVSQDVSRRGNLSSLSGSSVRKGLYECSQCGRHFTVTTKTPLHAYKAFGKNYAAHDSVNHGAKEFSRNDVHVNTAKSFNAILERAKQGVFHYLSRGHLRRYIGEVAFRWNKRDPVEKKIKEGVSKIVMQAKPILEQFQNLLKHAFGTQLRRTIYGGIATPQPSFG